MNYTIEDYIEFLSGVITPDNQTFVFDLDSSDKNLIFSLAKQTIRGIAFTDRQFELAKTKVLYYEPQLKKVGFDLLTIDNLRYPLRKIDRSKWIKIIDNKSGEPCIGVRFPFTKKMIKYIDFLEKLSDRKNYDKANKIHFVPINESNIYSVIEKFKDANFDIDDNLTHIHREILHMKNNNEEYAPGIFGFKLKNLHDNAIEYALSSIGEPNIENLARYKDKQDALGIVHFDESDLATSVNATQPLTRRLIYRKQKTVFVSNKEFTIDNLAETLLELYRFPVLFLLPEADSLDYLIETHHSFRNIIPNDKITNLYRKENDTEENKEYNRYIKENKINNPLAIDSKIVYTTNNKIPKPMIEIDWTPSVAVLLTSKRVPSNVETYLNDLDLVIHYDDDATPWARYVERI